MELDIRGLGLEPTPALRRDIARRLHRSLRSFDTRVERVTLRLARHPGRSRHAMLDCLITVVADGLAPVYARCRHRSMRVACSRATALARHMLASAVHRILHAGVAAPRGRPPARLRGLTIVSSGELAGGA